MRKFAILGLSAVPLGFSLLLPSGCGDLPTGVVSIRPNYAWEDGCAQVKIGGNGFGEDVSVTLGGTPLENLSLPDPSEDEDDVGYVVYGTVPAGEPGFVDLEMSTGEFSDSVSDVFYYVTCPGQAYIEAAEPVSGITPGTTINLQGCGIDTSGLTVKVGASTDEVSLASVCGTASATFEAPSNDDGTWYVGFFDSEGNQVSPAPECDITQPFTGVDTADTGYYYDYYYGPCSGALTLTYGGDQ